MIWGKSWIPRIIKILVSFLRKKIAFLVPSNKVIFTVSYSVTHVYRLDVSLARIVWSDPLAFKRSSHARQGWPEGQWVRKCPASTLTSRIVFAQCMSEIVPAMSWRSSAEIRQNLRILRLSLKSQVQMLKNFHANGPWSSAHNWWMFIIYCIWNTVPLTDQIPENVDYLTSPNVSSQYNSNVRITWENVVLLMISETLKPTDFQNVLSCEIYELICHQLIAHPMSRELTGNKQSKLAFQTLSKMNARRMRFAPYCMY